VQVTYKLAGLIIAISRDVKDNEIPFGKTAYEIIAESVQSYPILSVMVLQWVTNP
jgi:hypothetical protein